MGDCYFVNLEIKVKDAEAIAEALRDYIETNPRNADFNLDKWQAQGVGTETLDDLITIMLAGWTGQKVSKREIGDGFISYSNGFNASYAWRTVMQEMFDEMTPYIEDGSSIEIDGDECDVIYTFTSNSVIECPAV